MRNLAWGRVVIIRVPITFCDGKGWHIQVRALEVVVVAQWIRPRTLNREVPGSNLLAAAVVPPWARHFILIA